MVQGPPRQGPNDLVALQPDWGPFGACDAAWRRRAGSGSARRTRGSQYRQSPPPPKRERVPSGQPRALSEVERNQVLRVLHDPEQVDEAPATVYAKLLDAGVSPASTSTMDRLLRAEGEVHERPRQATHPPKVKPELLTRPNAVWSWDITKLGGPAKWTWFYL
jgi:putative transposase